ncbi:CopG family transcriptional regulator [Nocardia otitidiscaviarum]|uniref:CopG family transcriptional regulator n=1 Tax=Nocardia otitidiscaviarum TaxID=1823 RepID=A0A516NH36_9NOCA|nr:ribbon-helix-helix protein, CopG family [Nocardia otitidiscaviarum]MBF6236873.1 CopG family transcriptional regulator [Nocardia otitidiscaviarum]MCP9625184.1 ribbon-helix-helix domain-containing protein [Nocardia otitidiscaviarum]QDP78224.1 CopG family transcriptional regulator [Nocardia otitidiscaviarum]
MTDILIRDVPEPAIEEIDRRARELGVSRSEFLRRWLSNDFRPATPVTTGDLSRFSELAQDLGNPEVMGRAWS